MAQLTGNPAALVTTGAAGAILSEPAPASPRDDADKAKRLPFTDGMKNEVIAQKLHLTGWVRQCEAAGARMVEVEEKDELERAINGKTAMLYFLVADRHFGRYRDKPDAPGGKVSLEVCAAIAKKTRIPLLVDAAAGTAAIGEPERLRENGGRPRCLQRRQRDTRPADAGLLVGRKDLVEFAATFQSPYSGIGRDLKIAKETYIGMLAAVERYLNTDHKAE